MPKRIDLSGRRYGKLLVIGWDNDRGKSRWICRCDCGNVSSVFGCNLNKGTSLSCGCTHRAQLAERNKKSAKHNQDNPKMLCLWKGMMARCENKNHTAYHRYGGRGITVCERWRVFANFIDDMGVRPKNTTLDRIDNSKGYSPENCRWATVSEQQRNKRSNNIVEFNGERKCLAEWSENLGIPLSRLSARLRRGWPIESALTAHRYKKKSSFTNLHAGKGRPG